MNRRKFFEKFGIGVAAVAPIVSAKKPIKTRPVIRQNLYPKAKLTNEDKEYIISRAWNSDLTFKVWLENQLAKALANEVDELMFYGCNGKLKALK